MKLVFWKKDKKNIEDKKKPLIFIVTGEDGLSLARLLDEFYSKNSTSCNEARIRFWTEVANMYPETSTGSWEVKGTRFGVKIVEQL